MDRVAVFDLRMDVIVGILPHEREEPQPLIADVELDVDLEPAGETGDLSTSVDYGAVANEVRFLAGAGHWRLLETLAVALLRHLVTGPVQSARIRLRKPAILDRAVPAVRMERGRAWAEPRRRTLAEGVEAEVLVEVEDAGAYRVHLDGAWALGRPAEVLVIDGATDRLATGEQALWTGETELTGKATFLLVVRPRL